VGLCHIISCLLTGGTFALYSLLCRHAKLSLLPNQQEADEELSTYKMEMPPETARGMWVKKLLEKHQKLRTGLLVVVYVTPFFLRISGVFYECDLHGYEPLVYLNLPLQVFLSAD